MLDHWDDLQQEEQQLAGEEAQVSTTELALSARETQLKAGAHALQAGVDALAERLAALSTRGIAGARELIDQLPHIVPPPGVLERMRAIKSREQCLAARKLAVEARNKSLLALQTGTTQCRLAAEKFVGQVNALETAAQKPVISLPPPRAPVAPVAPVAARGVEEKRQYPRAPVHCEVSLSTESNFYSGFTQDLSQGGVFLATFDLLPIGTQVDLQLSLPGMSELALRGVVRWLREYNALNPDLWSGMGIEFVDLPEPAKTAIVQFVARRAPWFFTE